MKVEWKTNSSKFLYSVEMKFERTYFNQLKNWIKKAFSQCLFSSFPIRIASRIAYYFALFDNKAIEWNFGKNTYSFSAFLPHNFCNVRIHFAKNYDKYKLS